jgi:hypothetical protein
MGNRPNLSLHTRAQIEKAKEKIFQSSERFNLLFLPAIPPLATMADVIARFNPSASGTTAPKQRMPSVLHIQIEDFTGSLFDIEAPHYGHHTQDPEVLRSWLNELAAEIIKIAQRQVADERLDFHLSIQQRENIIGLTLESRVEHWIEQKKGEIERIAKAQLAPQTSIKTVIDRVDDAMSDAPKPQSKNIRERLDNLALDIGHDALAAKIGIPRSSYYSVKAGGGKTTRKKVERYLSELDSTDPKTKLD